MLTNTKFILGQKNRDVREKTFFLKKFLFKTLFSRCCITKFNLLLIIAIKKSLHAIAANLLIATATANDFSDRYR